MTLSPHIHSALYWAIVTFWYTWLIVLEYRCRYQKLDGENHAKDPDCNSRQTGIYDALMEKGGVLNELVRDND